MQPLKVFIPVIIAFFLLLLFVDWIDYSVLKHKFVFLFGSLKVIILIAGGILIMRFSLDKALYKVAFWIFTLLWCLFFIFKGLYIAFGNFSVVSEQIHIRRVYEYFIRITQILTPLPVIFFYLLNRIMVTGILTRNEP